jgi:uncharacterized coiled-coil protein SlyX
MPRPSWSRRRDDVKKRKKLRIANRVIRNLRLDVSSAETRAERLQGFFAEVSRDLRSALDERDAATAEADRLRSQPTTVNVDIGEMLRPCGTNGVTTETGPKENEGRHARIEDGALAKIVEKAMAAKGRADAATKSPWSGHPNGTSVWAGDTMICGTSRVKDPVAEQAVLDIDFIADASADVPELANIVLAMADEIVALRAESVRAVASPSISERAAWPTAEELVEAIDEARKAWFQEKEQRHESARVARIGGAVFALFETALGRKSEGARSPTVLDRILHELDIAEAQDEIVRLRAELDAALRKLQASDICVKNQDKGILQQIEHCEKAEKEAQDLRLRIAEIGSATAYNTALASDFIAAREDIVRLNAANQTLRAKNEELTKELGAAVLTDEQAVAVREWYQKVASGPIAIGVTNGLIRVAHSNAAARLLRSFSSGIDKRIAELDAAPVQTHADRDAEIRELQETIAEQSAEIANRDISIMALKRKVTELDAAKSSRPAELTSAQREAADKWASLGPEGEVSIWTLRHTGGNSTAHAAAVRLLDSFQRGIGK